MCLYIKVAARYTVSIGVHVYLVLNMTIRVDVTERLVIAIYCTLDSDESIAGNTIILHCTPGSSNLPHCILRCVCTSSNKYCTIQSDFAGHQMCIRDRSKADVVGYFYCKWEVRLWTTNLLPKRFKFNSVDFGCEFLLTWWKYQIWLTLLACSNTRKK